ncbi:MAG: tRNA (adenosine(37)-N6)-threonylcarbamoyltransferase complex ATPase subunit type 1 TsaE [Jiangellales bacterium]
MTRPDAPATGTWSVPTAEHMHHLGVRLGGLLRAGDLVLLDGGLGAGKTTLTRGIGEGLGVTDPVTSPTFVIAREHPPTAAAPGLVHVDAYRLTSPDELDDLDLAPAMATSVTVVEWASGRAEHLGEHRLELTLLLSPDDSREVRWSAVGVRWQPDLSRVAGCGERSSPRPSPGRPA